MQATRLPVLGQIRLLAIVMMIAGLMTPSFPTSGPGELKPCATSELAWNPPLDTSFDLFVEGEEIPAEPIEDEPTEAPEQDEASVDLNESLASLYVSGARRSIPRPSARLTPDQPRVATKASTHTRSGRGDRSLALDLPTRLCRLTC